MLPPLESWLLWIAGTGTVYGLWAAGEAIMDRWQRALANRRGGR